MIRAIVFLMTTVIAVQSHAQSQEAAQLLLNYQKLKQLEEILDNMYKGYKILSTGYNRIKDIAEGNFKLHQVFLDGLYGVSPVVREYSKVPQIINYQLILMREQKRAYARFSADDHLTPEEIRYLTSVYAFLVKESIRNLERLTMIITASKLRMSDDDRLKAIDSIHLDMEDKLNFLHGFNNSTQLLIIQRAKQQGDVDVMRKLYELE
jgi:hypothetical protein